MAATLTTLRDRVEQILADTANAIWDPTWLDEAIRLALAEYSQANPLAAVTTLTVPADSYELDISAVSDLLAVTEVWVPYTAADPEHPPNRRAFEHWFDEQTLFFPDYQLQNGQTLRLFYTTPQTLNGLDAAAATSLPLSDESLLVTGAAGHAAASRALDLTEQVTLDRLTAQQVRAWGLSKLQEFRTGLRRVEGRRQGTSSAFVPQPPLDRWDDEGDWA